MYNKEFEEMEEIELLNLYNRYAESNGYEMIYYLDDDFYDTYYDNNLADFARNIYYSSEYNPNDEYITLDGYGHFVTSDSLIDLIEKQIDLEELEEYARKIGYDLDDE